VNFGLGKKNEPVGISPSENAMCPPYLVVTSAICGFDKNFSNGKANSNGLEN
jgi:hypothetical protein